MPCSRREISKPHPHLYTHTPDAWVHLPKLRFVRFYTKLNQPALFRARSQSQTCESLASSCVSQTVPGHPQELNGSVGEIHTPMRLKKQNCHWACPSSLVLPSGSSNPFNVLSQITKSPPLEEKGYQPPLRRQSATNTLVTGPNSWLQDRCNDLYWVPGRLHPGRGQIPSLHPEPLLPTCPADPALGSPPRGVPAFTINAHRRYGPAPHGSSSRLLTHAKLVACLSYLEPPWSSPRYWPSFLAGPLKTVPWWTVVIQSLYNIHAYLGDTVGLVSEHCNKANTSVKQVTWIFWFPTTYKSYVHAVVC